MKLLIISLMTFFISINTVYSADKWDNKDLSLASVFTAATIIDWGQTRDIVKTNRKEEECGFRLINDTWIPACVYPHRETNLYLGENPSMDKVDTYMPLAIAASLTAAHYLPKKYRKLLLYGLSLLELSVIYDNHQLGLRINF